MSIKLNDCKNYTKAYKLLKGYRECPKCETLTYPERLNLYPNGLFVSNLKSKDGYDILICSNCKYEFAIDLPNPRIM